MSDDLAHPARLAPRAPASTYRLHLRGDPDETLWSSIDILDYVRDLGADAVYLSPILAATPGSTHAYDVVDPTTVDEGRGGEDAFIAFSDRARELGLKVILDVVPNHMGVEVPRANPYWWSVLREGASSPYAEYFDIDWAVGKLLLPVLSSDPGADLAAAEYDGEIVRVHGVEYPVADGTGDGTAQEVLDRQHYRLTAHDDPESPTYRRFFNVNGLAAIRQENPDVFDWANRRYLDWVADGRADGLRLDHLDGLAQPADYLARLQQAHPGLWVLPEVVLERGEQLPTEFACAGTTGYDVMSYLDRVIIDPAGERAFIGLDSDLGTSSADVATLIEQARRDCVAGPINADVERLARLAPEIPDARAALDELLVQFRCYRTFLPYDGAELERAVPRARDAAPAITSAIDAIAALLRNPEDPLAVRFQQTSGSLMGIAVESWVFFRFGRLTSLAEIGGNPLWWSAAPREMHAFLDQHEQTWPYAMTTLATHDTKRGEDVRARLAVLSELASEWSDDVRRWFRADPPANYALGTLLLQALIGAWPVSDDDLDFYVTKAAREFGQETSWDKPDPEFEAGLRAWVERFRSDTEIADEVQSWTRRLAPYGWSNSLTIKALQLSGPGVPDVYRGSEGWNLDLVDPLNRKTVDYGALRASLARRDDLVPIDETGAAKVKVVSTLLRLRRQQPDAFRGYRPLYGEGPAADHLVAFARDGVIVVGTRLPIGLERDGGWRDTLLSMEGRWRDELTGAAYDGPIQIAELLTHYPVAVLLPA